MKLKFYTTSNDIIWYRRQCKTIAEAWSSMKGMGKVEIEVVQIDVPNPVIIDERISWDWMTKEFGQGLFHFTPYYKKKWGIKSTINGSRNRGQKLYPQFWVCCDRRKASGYDNLTEFERLMYHEMAHFFEELDDDTGDKLGRDSVHFHDYKLKRIHKYHELIEWKEPSETPRMAIMRMIIEVQKALVKLLTSLLDQRKLQPIVERTAQAVIDEMDMLGHPVRVVEGYRSIERQDELYRQGRTTPGAIVTNAKGGESMHNYGVAVDFTFREYGYDAPEKLWQTLGKVGEGLGFEWGGRWKSFTDKPHFQMTMGYTLKDFQQGKVDYSLFK